MQLPEDVANAVNGDASKAIPVRYKNWKGEVAVRNIIPLSVFYGSNDFHKDVQWLMKVWDMEKQDYRTYALKDILEWIWEKPQTK